MRIGLAQINARIGDFRGNQLRIAAAVAAAHDRGAELVVLPELVLCGYPPRDLLYDPDFVREAQEATAELARMVAGGPAVLVGTVEPSPDPAATPRHPNLRDVAALLAGGHVVASRAKRLLPVYDVFYEPRWFVPGPPAPPLELPAPPSGARLGVLVCEDLWDEGYGVQPVAELAAHGVDALVCVSASPFRAGVAAARLHHARRAVARTARPLVYVNAVGANDELIFDGDSFMLDATGRVVLRLPRCEEAVRVVDLASLPAPVPETPTAPLSPEAELLDALTLGVRDFLGKGGLRRAFIGLSGGIDSALVACIAQRALGGAAVTGIALPSRHSDPRSTESARELAANLGIGFEVVPIEPLHAAAETVLAPLLGDAGGPDTTLENVQARLRAMILMAHVNRRGGVLLNTSNKTELSLGYSTLYGDMSGALGVIADLTKPEVYALARHVNAAAGRSSIPPFILDRPPSAELRPDQVDPFDYPHVSPLVESLVQGMPAPALTPAAALAPYRQMLRTSEHKRWQFGIVLKVSERAFGTGRMVPVTRR